MDAQHAPAGSVEAHRITKPIQLLAAWLVGLTAVDSAFLVAASTITAPVWLQATLVIAAVANVPIFLGALFLLQTRFRPEMQEDTYYSRYLESRQTNKETVAIEAVSTMRSDVIQASSRALATVESLDKQIGVLAARIDTISLRDTQASTDLGQLTKQLSAGQAALGDAKRELNWGRYRVDVNDLLASYVDVRVNLAALGVHIADTFGSSSSVAAKPAVYVLTFGRGVDPEDVQQLIRALEPTGLMALWYSKEPHDERRIYVGSYGYFDGKVAPLTQQLRTKVLRNGLTGAELEELLAQSSVRLIPDLAKSVEQLPELLAKVGRLEFELVPGGVRFAEEIAKELNIPLRQVKKAQIALYRALDNVALGTLEGLGESQS